MGAIDLQKWISDEDRRKWENKWWRLNNLYWIVNEAGDKVPFRCNWAQERFYDDLWYFNILLKARQWGGTTFIDLFILDDCLFTPNLEAGIIAHNKDDAQKIFRRKVKFPYDHLPDWLKEQVPLVTDSRTELAFANGSILYVATSVRSGTVQRLHISEFGKICAKYPDKAEEIVTGSLNAVHPGSMVWIESTAEGNWGYFYEFCKTAQDIARSGAKLKNIDYKFHFVAWHHHPGYRMDPEDVVITREDAEYFDELLTKHGVSLDDAQKAWYVKKKSLLNDKMLQEFPSTPEEAFQAALKGAYFAVQMAALRKNKQICRVPYDPALPVNTAWDLGVDDETFIVFHQRYRQENHLIDCYYNHGYGFGHYANVLQERGYTYGKHYLPHDIEAREFGKGTAPTKRLDTLRSLMPGQRIEVIPRVHDLVAEGIEAVRMFLPTCWIDAEKCDYLIKCLDGYQREWDERLAAFKAIPLHNWAAHGADAARTLAMGFVQPDGTAGQKYKSRRRKGGMAA